MFFTHDPYVGLQLNSTKTDIVLHQPGTTAASLRIFATIVIKNHLTVFLGQWRYNQTIGVPWIQEVFYGGEPNLPLLSALFRSQISSLFFVSEIRSFDLSFSGSSGMLNVRFIAVIGTEEVPIEFEV